MKNVVALIEELTTLVEFYEAHRRDDSPAQVDIMEDWVPEDSAGPRPRIQRLSEPDVAAIRRVHNDWMMYQKYHANSEGVICSEEALRRRIASAYDISETTVRDIFIYKSHANVGPDWTPEIGRMKGSSIALYEERVRVHEAGEAPHISIFLEDQA